jgi:hypothetical protein
MALNMEAQVLNKNARLGRTLATLLVSLAIFSSCAYIEEPTTELPAEVVRSKVGGGNKMVIVLPDKSDTLRELRSSGIVDAIQRGMPDADVVLLEFTQNDYLKTRGSLRVHEQIIQPAKARGYREFYLAGAGEGGMGVLSFERARPNAVQGLILMSPYMGDTALVREIKEAGGLGRWNPGPLPSDINTYTAERENWRMIKSWITNRERTQDVWLICGKDDRFYPAAEIIASILPRGNFVTPSGGDSWKVWAEGASEAFAMLGEKTQPGFARD